MSNTCESHLSVGSLKYLTRKTHKCDQGMKAWGEEEIAIGSIWQGIQCVGREVREFGEDRCGK